MRTYIYRDQVICQSCGESVGFFLVPEDRLTIEPNEEPDQVRQSDTCPLCNRYLLEDPDHEDDQL